MLMSKFSETVNLFVKTMLRLIWKPREKREFAVEGQEK